LAIFLREAAAFFIFFLFFALDFLALTAFAIASFLAIKALSLLIGRFNSPLQSLGFF
jgi:hypothetical protein